MTGMAVLGNYPTPQVVLAGTKPSDYNHTRTPMMALQCFSLSGVFFLLLFWNVVCYIKTRKRNGPFQAYLGWEWHQCQMVTKVPICSELQVFHLIIAVLIDVNVVYILFSMSCATEQIVKKADEFVSLQAKVNSDKIWKSCFMAVVAFLFGDTAISSLPTSCLYQS